MSTRTNIHFCEGETIVANIYRHYDGSPEVVLKDLEQFFSDVEAQTHGDTRFDDASYLAAKFIVWQAARYAAIDSGFREAKEPLNFLGLGVMHVDAGDGEYIYELLCEGRDRPRVRWCRVKFGELNRQWREGMPTERG